MVDRVTYQCGVCSTMVPGGARSWCPSRHVVEVGNNDGWTMCNHCFTELRHDVSHRCACVDTPQSAEEMVRLANEWCRAKQEGTPLVPGPSEDHVARVTRLLDQVVRIRE